VLTRVGIVGHALTGHDGARQQRDFPTVAQPERLAQQPAAVGAHVVRALISQAKRRASDWPTTGRAIRQDRQSHLSWLLSRDIRWPRQRSRQSASPGRTAVASRHQVIGRLALPKA